MWVYQNAFAERERKTGHDAWKEDAILSAQAAKLFLRPKMPRVRLFSRGFFAEAEASFFSERPERTDLASEAGALSSKYFSL